MNEYEKQLNQLFDKLIDALEWRDDILWDINEAINSTKLQEEKDSLFEKLQQATIAVNNALDELKDFFEEDVELTNPEETSERIRIAASYIATAKLGFNRISKSRVSTKVINQNSVVHENSKQLANKILAYNECHEVQLITFNEAIDDEFRKLKEDLNL